MTRGYGIAMLLLVVAGSVWAEDWPQFLGPRRNGVSTATGLLKTWGKAGPKMVWSRDVGQGFSGPVVVGQRLLLLQRVEDKEVLACLDARDGKPLWQASYACTFEDAYGKGNGPRATPTVAGDFVYTLGADGWLQCTKLTDGAKVWGFALKTAYKTPQSFFGVGSSPVVEGNLLLVNVGAKDAGIVAFACADGKEVWKATGDGASYASPIVATLDGKRTAVFLTRQGLVLLDPAKGTVQHQKEWKARYAASVNAATPLAIGNEVFISASYETGALLVRLAEGKLTEVWQGEEILSNHYNTSVHHDGYLYGIEGRQEPVGGASLRCIALQTGKVQWTRERFGCAALLLAEGRLLALTEHGDLVLISTSAKGYEELARTKVFEHVPVRAHPALAHGKLYARDQQKLVCWEMKE